MEVVVGTPPNRFVPSNSGTLWDINLVCYIGQGDRTDGIEDYSLNKCLCHNQVSLVLLDFRTSEINLFKLKQKLKQNINL